MVSLMVLAPSPDLLEPMRKMAEELAVPEVRVEVAYISRVSEEAFRQFKRYDVLVARGVLYHSLCEWYPEKQVVRIAYDGLDILDTLRQCREMYHPSVIGLCQDRDQIQDLIPALESFCGAEIYSYPVTDRESVQRAVRRAKEDGVEVMVSSGMAVELCREMGIPCVDIRLRWDTLQRTLTHAMQTARSIQMERSRCQFYCSMLDSTKNAILVADTAGLVRAVNRRAIRLFHLERFREDTRYRVEQVHPALQFLDSKTSVYRDGELQLLMVDGQPYVVDYQRISDDPTCPGTMLIIREAAQVLREERCLRDGKRGPSADRSFRDIVAVSEQMRSQVELAKRFSLSDANVLLTGETGVGKELFARSIHTASVRRDQPFVTVHCAAVSESLLERELFGYAPWSFSAAEQESEAGLFELAHHGTIFLDEIGEMPLSLQVKLLRVLQEQEIRRVGSSTVIPVDVRVIAAADRNLQEQIEQGQFRRDLLYRLNPLELYLPPLRERREDIPALLDYHLNLMASCLRKAVPTLLPDALQQLCSYPWRGNVRELRSVCRRLMVLCAGQAVDAEKLERHQLLPERSAPITEPVRAIDPETVRALQASPRKKDLAKELGISRTTLWRRTKRLEAEQRRKEESQSE